MKTSIKLAGEEKYFMKNLTEDDYLEALDRGINIAKASAKKENRDLYDFEKELVDSAEATKKKILTTSYHFKRIAELVQKNYIEESVILSVTLFEILMRDLVKDRKKLWFLLPNFEFSSLSSEKKLETRKKIKKYLNDLKLYPQYLQYVFLYQDNKEPEIDALYHTLFDDEKNLSEITFQNLNREWGVRPIIKLLFNIEIKDWVNSDKKIAKKDWELLEKLIKDRNNIVHHGEKTKLEPQEVIEAIRIIDTLIHNINHEILRFAFSEEKKQFEKIKQDLEQKMILKTN